MMDSGHALGLGNHYLRFASAPRYRLSTGFGSMGHASAGVIGAALASAGKAVALVGDGALLMTNEINTAVGLDVDTVWIVLNDGRYGMVAQGMEALGWNAVRHGDSSRGLRRRRARPRGRRCSCGARS